MSAGQLIPNVQPIFPDWLDSTMVSTFKSCPYKFYLEYILNYKPKDVSVHLHAGASYATGLEVARKAFFAGIIKTPYYKEVPVEGSDQLVKKLDWRIVQEKPTSAEDAAALGLGALLAAYGDFQCPPDSAKSAERTAGAFEFYLANYPLGACGAIPYITESGKHCIEFTFAEPLDAVHPVTGNPLLYCGGSDQVVRYSGGIFIEDDKTTSSLGATWSKQWDLRSQFTGYSWGQQRAGIAVNGCLIRGVSILKTKYDTQQAITYRSQWQIDEWMEVLLDTIEEMKRYWERSWWRQSLDHACAEYGGCSMRQVCLNADKKPWLEQYFQRRQWNPLTRQETLLP